MAPDCIPIYEALSFLSCVMHNAYFTGESVTAPSLMPEYVNDVLIFFSDAMQKRIVRKMGRFIDYGRERLWICFGIRTGLHLSRNMISLIIECILVGVWSKQFEKH